MNEGSYTGKQPQTVSDPGTTLHETCWIWKPTPVTEVWILYRGPTAFHPYVDPSASEPLVWLDIEYIGGPELFGSQAEFVAWVLDRLLQQGRPNLPTDIEVRVYAIVPSLRP